MYHNVRCKKCGSFCMKGQEYCKKHGGKKADAFVKNRYAEVNQDTISMSTDYVRIPVQFHITREGVMMQKLKIWKKKHNQIAEPDDVSYVTEQRIIKDGNLIQIK